MARRRNKQKNSKKQNKFKTNEQYYFSTVSSSDVDKIAYQVFGALTYSSKKTF